MEQVLYLILVLVTLLVLVGLYWLAFRSRTGRPRKGQDIPDAAKAKSALSAAKQLARMQGYEVIAPAPLAIHGHFADLDFIVVGRFGVLGVKCIGRGGEIYGDVDDPTWLQVKGEQRISFANPMKAAQADTRVIRDALFAAKLKNVPVEAVCVFTNSGATLALPRSTGHYTLRTFKALLRRDRFLQDKRVDIAAAAAAIRACVAPPTNL